MNTSPFQTSALKLPLTSSDQLGTTALRCIAVVLCAGLLCVGIRTALFTRGGYSEEVVSPPGGDARRVWVRKTIVTHRVQMEPGDPETPLPKPVIAGP